MVFQQVFLAPLTQPLELFHELEILRVYRHGEGQFRSHTGAMGAQAECSPPAAHADEQKSEQWHKFGLDPRQLCAFKIGLGAHSLFFGGEEKEQKEEKKRGGF